MLVNKCAESGQDSIAPEDHAMTTPRPNVLLVLVDQWPGPLLGAAGHSVIQTPTLDQLAAMGVRFSRAYSECPICIPARRTLMTGTTTRTHGDRVFGTVNRMPDLPTVAQSFRDGGYQAMAVGKLHVYPPRDRIGFDDVLLSEEGRPHLGTVDDHDQYLASRGFPGQQFMHGMNNNNYLYRPWHLPEDCHVTNWATAEMSRQIKRRDPTRPAFWMLSYTHPHPPLVPLQCYLDLYRPFAMDAALEADWAKDPATLPRALRMIRDFYPAFAPEVVAEIRRAFYALCTHIDHQLRIVLGTLREEGLLDETVIMVAADHGDMLGDFGLFAKRTYYERSANVPMILAGPPGHPAHPGRHHRHAARRAAGRHADAVDPGRHRRAAELRRHRHAGPDPQVHALRRLPGDAGGQPHAARRPDEAHLVSGRQRGPALRPRGRPARARGPRT
jgi:arylsulfatase